MSGDLSGSPIRVKSNQPLRLESILTNHLVLNLRSHARLEVYSELTSKRDTFFCEAYGVSKNPEKPLSVADSILGNIGDPLRVDDEDDEVVEEGDISMDRITEVFHVDSEDYPCPAVA